MFSVIQDKSPIKCEIRSPASKKPRLFDKVAVKEIKKELSEDEAPTPIVKRPGRRGIEIFLKRLKLLSEYSKILTSLFKA